MTRALVALVALAGCNRIFHLNETVLIDGPPPVDGLVLFTSPDGSKACPPLPDLSTWKLTPHALAGFPGAVITPSFLAVDRVVFMYQTAIWTSGLDGGATEIQELLVNGGEDLYSPAALADHDVFWYVRSGASLGGGGLFYAAYDGQQWVEHRADLPSAAYFEPGVPGFYDGMLRMVVSRTKVFNGPMELVELESANGINWRELETISLDPITVPIRPRLSADGCWLVFSAKAGSGYQLFETGRDASGAFTTPIPVASIPPDPDHVPEAAFDPTATKMWISEGGGGVLVEARP